MKRWLAGAFALVLCSVVAHAAIYGGARRFIGGGQESETGVLISSVSTIQTADRISLINSTIRSLKTSGVWDRLDTLWVLAAADTQIARKNWKNPGTFDLSLVNAPTFVVDRGYTGDGAASGLSGPNLATFGGQYRLNDAHLGVWCGTDVTEAGSDIGTAGNGFIRAHVGAATGTVRANDGTSTSVGFGTTAIGHSLWSRGDAASYVTYKNGAATNNVAVAATAVTSAAIGVGFASSSFGTKRIAAGHLGASLTAQQVFDLYTALAAYMVGVGAP